MVRSGLRLRGHLRSRRPSVEAARTADGGFFASPSGEVAEAQPLTEGVRPLPRSQGDPLASHKREDGSTYVEITDHLSVRALGGSRFRDSSEDSGCDEHTGGECDRNSVGTGAVSQ